MTKCDFCTKSDSKGNCYWSFQSARESDCRKAGFIDKFKEELQKEVLSPNGRIKCIFELKNSQLFYSLLLIYTS